MSPSCSLAKEKNNWITPGMKITEKTTPENTPELDSDQLDDSNIALKINVEGEMRTSTVQQEKNIIKVGTIKNNKSFLKIEVKKALRKL